MQSMLPIVAFFKTEQRTKSQVCYFENFERDGKVYVYEGVKRKKRRKVCQ